MQNFVAFSEYMNFTSYVPACLIRQIFVARKNSPFPYRGIQDAFEKTSSLEFATTYAVEFAKCKNHANNKENDYQNSSNST